MPTYLYSHGEDGFEIGPGKAKNRIEASKMIEKLIKKEFGPRSHAKNLIRQFHCHPEYLEELTEQ